MADIVAEWTRLHGLSFELELTGPAGGGFTSGAGGEQLQIDAIELVWVLAGRGSEPATGLLAHELPLWPEHVNRPTETHLHPNNLK